MIGYGATGKSPRVFFVSEVRSPSREGLRPSSAKGGSLGQDVVSTSRCFDASDTSRISIVCKKRQERREEETLRYFEKSYNRSGERRGVSGYLVGQIEQRV